MISNPLLGVFFHWLGGLAAGSFYVPYRAVRQWSWEVYWLVGGVFSWIVAPWLLAAINTNGLLATLGEAPRDSLLWAYFWGTMWGVGGLTFGLSMRYLGLSLGMGVALGYCAAFGTLMPPIFHGEFVSKVLGTTSGVIVVLGVGVCLAGIAIAGLAGRSKEKEMTDEQKAATIKEFNFTKGILVATFSGIMSASFAYGLDAAAPIAEISARHGTTLLWTGLPKLCVVLLGGFTTNFIWCVILNIKNRTGYQYFSRTVRTADGTPDPVPVPMLRNYLFSALAGVVWYLQFFFYSMGETQMGTYKFSSWTIHMASIIIFSTLWGIALKEWAGSSRSTKRTLFIGLATLILSTIVVGYGNYLGAG
ncbi:L-rhamnose-proton symporter [Anaerolineae bacterium]|nr:L-rhamnose-proton symporter [Anaerolineae bacterium]